MAERLSPLDQKGRRRESARRCEPGPGKGRLGRALAVLGPGMITGASDDDPSGIAACSQSGARFGYSQPWTVVLIYPLMTAVQEACARIGAVTGKGLAAAVRAHDSPMVLSLFLR
jgi:Mn2+/Fe2+ NRAMP family transporter